MSPYVFYVLGVVVWLCGAASWLMAYRLHRSLLSLSETLRGLAEAMTKPYARTGRGL